MLRRSKSSILRLISSKLECSSMGSIKSPSVSRLGLQPIKQSHLSLYLQGNSESSLCSQMGAFCNTDKPEDVYKIMWASPYTAASSTLSRLVLTDTSSITLVQCLVLVAMALQIPSHIDEIIEILELHIHSFPLLIALAVFPSLYLKKKQHKRDSSLNLSSRESDSAFAISSPAKRTSTQNPTDDWGCFADFENESMQDQDARFVVKTEPEE
jgi:hypothetical protein